MEQQRHQKMVQQQQQQHEEVEEMQHGPFPVEQLQVNLKKILSFDPFYPTDDVGNVRWIA